MSRKLKRLSVIDIALIICSSILLLIFIGIFVVLSIIENRDTNVKNNPTTKNQVTTSQNDQFTTEKITIDEETTGEEEEDTSFVIDGDIDGNHVSRASIVRAKFTTNEFWFVDSDFTAQYRVDLTKVIKSNLDGFAIVVEFSDSINLLDYWNMSASKEGNKLIFTVNSSIVESLNDTNKAVIGFVVKSDYETVPISYTIITNDVKEEINVSHMPPETTTEEEITGDETTTPEFEVETTGDEITTSEFGEETTNDEETTDKVDEETTESETIDSETSCDTSNMETTEDSTEVETTVTSQDEDTSSGLLEDETESTLE